MREPGIAFSALMNEKLDSGRLFKRMFMVYRVQFTLLVPAALCLFIPVAIVNGLVLAGDEGWGLLVSFPVGLVATFWYQGMVVEAVREVLDDRRDHIVGSLFSVAAPVIGPLIGAGMLAGIAVAIGLVLFIVPGLILLTMWAVIVPAIVIDRTGVRDAFGRSRSLVRDNGWRVFGVIVVLFLFQLLLTGILTAGAGGTSDDSVAGYALADLFVRVLIAPLSAIAATVLYVELRRVHGDPLGVTAPAPPPPLWRYSSRHRPPQLPEAPAAPPVQSSHRTLGSQPPAA
jgi:hypothetical protein